MQNFDFSEQNIYKLNRLVEKNSHKIAPAHFSKICATTGLFIFLIKDALEYAGVINDKKTPAGRVYHNLIFEIEMEQLKVKRLSNLLEVVYQK